MTVTEQLVLPFPIPDAEQKPHELERAMLETWREESLFAAVQQSRASAPPFVFFEGPPTANGRPGIHHVFARTVKDLFCRHRAMSGFFVPRKAGWDTHGLPVEIEVEKELQREKAAREGQDPSEVRKLTGKQLIEETGVAEFNRRCRDSVWKYRGDWESVSERMAYWLDYSDPYVTYHNNYVESVWWALATLHEKSLLTKGHKILPYCSRCGTALSSHEVAQGYHDVEDPSVYVSLDLAPSDDAPGIRRRIIVWTTTPWTLVSNTALAVHPTLAYAELRKKNVSDWTIILAEARVPAVLGADWADRWDVVRTHVGQDLVGQRYTRPLDWVEYPEEGVHEIIVGEEFVTADDGSGVVHMAPAFGADDYAAGKRHGLAFVQPVTSRGEFAEGTPLVAGLFVKSADPLIVEELERRGVLWKAQKFMHAYPHCWRCDTPLLYYARESWFIRTTAVREAMMSRNAEVNWNPPEIGAGRFGEWLSNNVDWAISRDRYWGTPLPVWVNDADASEIEVIGSFAQLAERVGRTLGEDFDPHKPFIDEYTWPARSGTGTMRRVPEVIDTWFDSGSMPFAQWHYPFENRNVVEAQYPADFIAEGVDQTRGWFYSLLAIATGLGDALPNNMNGAAPYKAVVVNDLVLDANGQKMSKSKGNVVDPWQVMDRHGADAVRLFLVASSQVWTPRRFDEDGIRELAGRFLLTLRNVYGGIFAQYANFGWAPSGNDPLVAERPALDRWILSRLTRVETEVNALLMSYDATTAAKRVMQFVDDDVSKWYVRLSRPRFYEVDGADNRAAFATLHEVLTVTSRLLAPFAPFFSDWLHRALTGSSVHLASFVREVTHTDAELEQNMAAIRALAGLGHAARDVADVRVRQPLSLLQCVVPAEAAGAADLAPLLASELNVKSVQFVTSTDALITLEGKPNFRVLGKKFGGSTPQVAAAASALTDEQLRVLAGGGAITIVVADEPREITPDDVTIVRRASGAAVVQEDGGFGVALDPTISPELRAEGLSREIVSRVQRLRRDAALAVSDRIQLAIAGDAEIELVAREYSAHIAGEVLATNVLVGINAGSPFHEGTVDDSWSARQDGDVDGRAVRIALRKDGT